MTGELTIKIGATTYDAYTEWGLSLEPEGWDAIRTPAPNKEPVKNKNVTEQGAVNDREPVTDKIKDNDICQKESYS